MNDETGTDTSAGVVMVVMEFGSRWPRCLEQLLGATPQGVVLAQDVTESAGSFLVRLRRRLIRLGSAEHRVSAAVLSVGHSLQSDVFVSRCLMVQVLARSLVPTGGKLVISGHAQLPDLAIQEASRVAATMAEHLVGAPELTLALDEPGSGLRRAVRRPTTPFAVDGFDPVDVRAEHARA